MSKVEPKNAIRNCIPGHLSSVDVPWGSFSHEAKIAWKINNVKVYLKVSNKRSQIVATLSVSFCNFLSDVAVLRQMESNAKLQLTVVSQVWNWNLLTRVGSVNMSLSFSVFSLYPSFLSLLLLYRVSRQHLLIVVVAWSAPRASEAASRRFTFQNRLQL